MLQTRNIAVAEAILEYAEMSEGIEDVINSRFTFSDIVAATSALTFLSPRQTIKEKLNIKYNYIWTARQLNQRRSHTERKDI